jgi:hypothetical protein
MGPTPGHCCTLPNRKPPAGTSGSSRRTPPPSPTDPPTRNGLRSWPAGRTVANVLITFSGVTHKEAKLCPLRSDIWE